MYTGSSPECGGNDPVRSHVPSPVAVYRNVGDKNNSILYKITTYNKCRTQLFSYTRIYESFSRSSHILFFSLRRSSRRFRPQPRATSVPYISLRETVVRACMKTIYYTIVFWFIISLFSSATVADLIYGQVQVVNICFNTSSRGIIEGLLAGCLVGRCCCCCRLRKLPPPMAIKYTYIYIHCQRRQAVRRVSACTP